MAIPQPDACCEPKRADPARWVVSQGCSRFGAGGVPPPRITSESQPELWKYSLSSWHHHVAPPISGRSVGATCRSPIITMFERPSRICAGGTKLYLKSGNALVSATFSNSILGDSLATSYEFTNLNWVMAPNTVSMIGIASEDTASVKWTINQSATKTNSTGFITGYTGYNAQEGSNVDNGLHGATISAVPQPSTCITGLTGLTGLGLGIRNR